MQMESSNSPPIHEGLGMLARFSLNKLNRQVSSTFVGLVLSWKHFLQASTLWMNVSMSSVVLAVAVDMIRVGSACRNGEREGTFYRVGKCTVAFFGTENGRELFIASVNVP